MEEIALAISRGLVGLIIPISLVAIALALALIEKSVRRLRRPNYLQPAPVGISTTSSVLERICAVCCALISLIGVVALVMNLVRGHPIAPAHFFAVLGLWVLLGAPALMWRSRWRLPAEGLATIGLSAVAVLTGFSIGVMFVPLLLAMVWMCIRHLRAGTNLPLSDHLPSG